jgi:hypothetical protein
MNPRSSLSLIKRSAFSVTMALLVTMPAAPTYASNPEPAPPTDPLVYRTRNTFTTKGFFNDSYVLTGLLLLGPSSAQKGNGFNPIENANVEMNVNVSPSRGYNFWSTPEGKFYDSYDSSLVVGFFNTAKENAKPNYYMASSSVSPEMVNVQSSLSTGDAIGKAVFRAPFKGAPKIWIPSSASSGFRYFNFNPAYMRDDQNYNGAFFFLGQADVPAVPAIEVSGQSKFSFDSKFTKMVQDKTFDQAAAIIEQWLQDEGYVNVPVPVGQEP